MEDDGYKRMYRALTLILILVVSVLVGITAIIFVGA